MADLRLVLRPRKVRVLLILTTKSRFASLRNSSSSNTPKNYSCIRLTHPRICSQTCRKAQVTSDFFVVTRVRKLKNVVAHQLSLGGGTKSSIGIFTFVCVCVCIWIIIHFIRSTTSSQSQHIHRTTRKCPNTKKKKKWIKTQGEEVDEKLRGPGRKPWGTPAVSGKASDQIDVYWTSWVWCTGCASTCVRPR